MKKKIHEEFEEYVAITAHGQKRQKINPISYL